MGTPFNPGFREICHPLGAPDCPWCNGDGTEPDGRHRCSSCGGTGVSTTYRLALRQERDEYLAEIGIEETR